MKRGAPGRDEAANGERMNIQILPLAKLKPAAYNPRTISDEALARLEASTAEFGLVEPLVVNKRTGYTVVGGHQRLKLLQKRGVESVECTVVDLPLSKEKALNVALNSTAMQGIYDFSKLADLLQEIDTGEFDVSALTGFDASELERIANWSPSTDKEETEPVPEPPKKAKSRLGDVWELGRHRLMCGDSTKAEDVGALMGKARASLVNTDPPYGIDYDSASLHDNKTNYAEIERDNLDGEKLQAFLEASIRVCLPFVLKNAAWYLWHPMLTQGTFFAAAAAADILISRQIIWVKPQLIFGRGEYHWKHELCFYGWVRGNRPEFYGDRNQTTVWEIEYAEGRNEREHPTQKPVKLFEIPLQNHTKPGEICYEPFAGSGPQLIAAEKLGRRCYAMEIEPRYVDVCVKRWQNFTGKKARNLARKGVTIA